MNTILMSKTYRQGAIGALLDEYERAISELQTVIGDIPDTALPVVVDTQTKDENCKTIRAILSHVVHAGFGYATSIRNNRGDHIMRPAKKNHDTVRNYLQDLYDMFSFTAEVFRELTDEALEQPDDSLKIKTGWGQSYDIEQLMEHAIVHILRHRRQIEKFKEAVSYL